MVTAASDRPGSTELMFKIPQVHGPKDFYQRTQWRLCARSNDNLVFQISRLDRFNLSATTPGDVVKSSQERRRPVQTEWEACIFDERWDDILGDNGALSLGESAGWDPSIAYFFPSTGNNDGDSKNGFSDFVECVNEVCHGLSEAKPW
jgi:hypothetical protein